MAINTTFTDSSGIERNASAPIIISTIRSIDVLAFYSQ